MLYKLPTADVEASATLWTPQAVIRALIDSFAVLSVTTGRVGPKKMKAFWPEYHADLADLADRMEAKPAKWRVKRRPSSVEVSRMEMVLLGWTDAKGSHSAWLNGNLMAYERPRLCLVAFIIAKSRGMTEVALCRQLGWSLATFKRHKLAAAKMIAVRLNASKVACW
ncbi:hypothetical protein [Devosia naphthalenivorans]|uniref:hypothetical protein n=1 Tax=Devosia naphthalenivorans TaxID=2082392 RepID=UPI000D3A4009|nr:hypothetical protein [Devosia naphthalenivorans]